MKQAIVNCAFHDLEAGVLRKVGDAFEVEDTRGEYLAALKLVQLKDVPEEAKPKRRRTKK